MRVVKDNMDRIYVYTEGDDNGYLYFYPDDDFPHYAYDQSELYEYEEVVLPPLLCHWFIQMTFRADPKLKNDVLQIFCRIAGIT